MAESPSDDFFGDEAKPDGPPRDRYGRPLLIPRDSTDGERRWYTRASSLADMLADFSHIQKWKMRYLARSLGRHPDLAALAGSEVYTTGFDQGDLGENRASGRRLDDVIERALDRGGISEKADYGTVVHAVTEPGNDGVADWYGNVEADRLSFEACVRENSITILGTELFTANDGLWVAGTFDHLMFVPGYGIIITDKKTSSAVHGHDFAIQLSTYANADLYDWETDQRITLEEFVARQGWNPALINRDQGVIFWIKNGKTSMHLVDLAAGLEAAHRATWVRDVHRKGTGQTKVDKDVAKALADMRGYLVDAIGAAGTEAEIMSIWANPVNQSVWTDVHTAAATARKRELTHVG